VLVPWTMPWIHASGCRAGLVQVMKARAMKRVPLEECYESWTLDWWE
jgi:hypothetical protein